MLYLEGHKGFLGHLPRGSSIVAVAKLSGLVTTDHADIPVGLGRVNDAHS